MQQTDLVTLRTFTAVVEAGGFSRAAELLDATTASVSRRVAALEQRLGTRLLNRTTRTMSLTEAGQRYYRDLVEILQALEEAEARVFGINAQPAGALHVTVPLSYGESRLSPLLGEFMARYPRLKMVLALDDGYRDIVAEGFDLALRIGELKESSLVAKRLAEIPRWFCAAPDYLQRRGRPQRATDLAAHACLHYNHIQLRDEWTLYGPAGAETVSVSGPLSANNGKVLLDAALRGQGIALLPQFIAGEALADGSLVRILEAYRSKPIALFAVWPSRRFTPTKVRLLVDFLHQRLGDPDEI